MAASLTHPRFGMKYPRSRPCARYPTRGAYGHWGSSNKTRHLWGFMEFCGIPEDPRDNDKADRSGVCRQAHALSTSLHHVSPSLPRFYTLHPPRPLPLAVFAAHRILMILGEAQIQKVNRCDPLTSHRGVAAQSISTWQQQ